MESHSRKVLRVFHFIFLLELFTLVLAHVRLAVSFILYSSKMKMPKQSSTVDKTLTPHIHKTEPHFKKSPIVPFIRITLPLFPMKFFLFPVFNIGFQIVAPLFEFQIDAFMEKKEKPPPK